MKFTNTPPIWEEQGVEPTAELQKKGFLAGYKPPAAYFNYLFNKISACIKELQTNLNNVDNTADIDKPTSTAQQASINAMLISGKGYGKNVGLPDSAAAPFNALSVLGVSKQPKTTGKNLFCPPAPTTANGVTLSAVNDYFVLNGTCTGSHNFIVKLPYPLEAGIYTLSANNPKNSGVNLSLIDIHNSDTADTLAVYDNANYGVNTKELAAGDNYTCRVRIESGVIYDNFIFKPQLEKGSTATSYEVYTGGVAAPNPEYPQVINSVGDSGSVEMRTTKKNLFQVATGTQNGVTLSKKDDYYILNGTCTGSYNFVLSLPYELEAGTYTISANNPKNNGIEFHLIDVHSSSLNETLGIYDNANYNQKTRQLQGGRYSCRVRIENGVTYDNFIFKPQLERGSTATSYEPYTETVKTLPLSVPLYGIPVASGGNYTDKNGQQWLCDEIDARGVYVQRLATVDLSTLEWSVAMNWWQATIDNMQYAASNIEYGVALAEYYRLRIASGMSMAEYGEFAIDTTNIKVDNGSTTEKPKGLLVYKLAEPVETPLSTEQLTALYGLLSYEGFTNVSTNDIGEISLEYFRNTYNGKAAALLKQDSQRIMLMLGDINTALDEIIGGA